MTEAEDIRHMLFGCSRAMEIWEGLGLSDFITACSRLDRSGSTVLEELLCSSTPGGIPHNIEFVVETTMITCWYLWWSRRHIKNKEPVPSPERSIMNIHGIIANSVKVRGSGNIVDQRLGFISSMSMLRLILILAVVPLELSSETRAEIL
jgi:hypothetical protein